MEISDEYIEKELLPLLKPCARPDVKRLAISYILGMTGDTQGRTLIGEKLKFVEAILSFAADEDHVVRKDAVQDVRQELVSHHEDLLQNLLPFMSFAPSVIRRRGIIGIVKNCCFEYDLHSVLLGPEVDLLPRLLLPLAGPEEFDEDDMERLPPDLQYLPPTQTREPDPESRKMLVQALTKLSSTRSGRAYLKEKNAYVILRELHKWEKVEDNLSTLMDLIDILIADEPQEGMEDLHKVEIPLDIAKKFEENP
ncbi:protein HGH1 homolog isoform X3 [Pomacea canaliculata]|uniref:protein HGH1 homolog isoform X3 n=1 Tax=Pomacea canaliculata TaxID=400727 RepID=UPI000D73C73C|nr:protein HGH1 homolog isoform X3 [Pomacea canaliculata]